MKIENSPVLHKIRQVLLTTDIHINPRLTFERKGRGKLGDIPTMLHFKGWLVALSYNIKLDGG